MELELTKMEANSTKNKGNSLFAEVSIFYFSIFYDFVTYHAF